MEAENITRQRAVEGTIPEFDPDTMLGGTCPVACTCAGCGRSIVAGNMMLEARTQQGEVISFHATCGMVAASESLNRRTPPRQPGPPL